MNLLAACIVLVGSVIIGWPVIARGQAPPRSEAAEPVAAHVPAVAEEGAGAKRWPALRQAASAFVSVDTRFGPLCLAAGGTRGAGGTRYLFLGPFWQ